MIDVTDEIKRAYDVNTTQVDKIILNDEEYRITNVEYYDDIYNDGNIFGTAIGKCLEFEIENTVDLEGQEVEYQTGIIVNGVTQWFSLGNFIIQDIDANDTTNKVRVAATDYLLKANIVYQSALNYGDGTVTLLDVLQEACTNSGITLATMDFTNSTFIVDSNQFADGTLNRQVIQAVAQISGTIAKIRNNQLYLIGPGVTISKVFTLNNYEEAEIKRATHPINLVSLGMTDIEGENVVLRDEDSITTNGENSLVINDNPFAYTQAKREQLITALFDAVNGFEYKAFSFKCQGLPYLETMDKVQFLDKEGNTYDSYVFRFNYKSPNGLESTIEAPSITKATVAYQNVASALQIAKRTEILVDKQNQTIQSVVSQTTDTSNPDSMVNKVSQVTQTVNELNSKISDIADITTSKESTNGTLSFEKINQSEPIYVKIYPTGENISYLYPNTNLYPSETLFLKNRKLRFINTTTNEYIDYELPADLLYYDADNYDEFILDYDAQTCEINKRVGYNADGTTYVLDTPQTIKYEYPRILLTDGDYEITLLGYHNAYLFVRLMAQNMYTTQFATKAEMNSEIKQTVKEVDIGVNEKLSNYSTTTQMNAAINVKAKQITESVESTYATKDALETEKSERTQTATEIKQEVSKKVGNDEIISKINQSAEEVQINADKIDIDGKAARFTTEINETKGRYTNEDLERIKQIILGNITATSTDYGKYDIDKDGEISSLDSFLIAKAVKETDGYIYLNGKFSIDPYSSSKAVSIYNNRTGEYSVMLGILNSFFQNLTIGTQIDFLKNEGSYISSEGFAQSIEHSNGYQSNTLHLQGDSNWFGMNYPDGGSVWISVNGEYEEEDQATIAINSKNTNSQTLLNPTGIRTRVVTQTSKESVKKNIEEYSEKALDIVKDSKIYEYNFKSEDDKHKKHIGFVIGDEGGEYKTPEQVISNDREGIENYSMTSILWKALQEQQELIEQLQNEIKELKKESE